MAAIVAQVNQIVSGFNGQPASSTSAGSAPTSTTTTSAPPASTSTSTGPLAPLYGQCAGIGWTGPTVCAAGTCTSYSPQYGQCLP